MKSILTHIKPGNLKVDHFHNSKFLALLKFWKHIKQLIRHFSIISLRLSYGCSARHLPGKNRRVWGASPIPQPCSEHYIFVSLSVGSWIVILFVHCSYRSVCGFTELITQQYTNLLSNSICWHKRNAVCHKLPVASSQLS